MTNNGEGLMEDTLTFCNENAIEKRFFLATAWSAALGRFMYFEAVYFGIFDNGLDKGTEKR